MNPLKLSEPGVLNLEAEANYPQVLALDFEDDETGEPEPVGTGWKLIISKGSNGTGKIATLQIGSGIVAADNNLIITFPAIPNQGSYYYELSVTIATVPYLVTKGTYTVT